MLLSVEEAKVCKLNVDKVMNPLISFSREKDLYFLTMTQQTTKICKKNVDIENQLFMSIYLGKEFYAKLYGQSKIDLLKLAKKRKIFIYFPPSSLTSSLIWHYHHHLDKRKHIHTLKPCDNIPSNKL